MTNIITFSGWGQSYDSLEGVAPGANHINYSSLQDIDELFESLKGAKCDVLIGWSLGGQIALRAIQAGILSPKSLILIAAPFQFIESSAIKCGMDKNVFNDFEEDFINNPEASLQRFLALISRNDCNAKEIITILADTNLDNANKWAYWLDELKEFSCSIIDLSKTPKTLAIHGENDFIVDITHTGLFAPFIANLSIKTIKKCGHAPHLHDAKRIKNLIDEFTCQNP